MASISSGQNIGKKQSFSNIFERKCANELNVKIICNSKKTWFMCEICDKQFSQKKNLNNQIRSHSKNKTSDKFNSEVKKHKCHLCGTAFAKITDLTQHASTHVGDREKSHKCEICSKSFAQSGHLKQHLLIHTGEKPHVCTECQKPFLLKQSLTRHFKIHTGIKPHKCQMCPKAFVCLGDLKKTSFNSHWREAACLS